MKTTLRDEIIKRFKTNWKEGKRGLVNSQTIQDIMHPITGKKHGTIGRELRRMADDELIRKEEIKNEKTGISSVWYEYLPTQHEQLSDSMKRV